ncbi:MAG TPA: sn-glycerol-3-phosphate ABC transporter ATP-binding protein UgpC [Rhodanobacteraceae bacterium]|nr:sn-glycerol-3-phosphate ABC transporter ATP-binding protein UgpC [Rhodanobacteraceae bacterium]
MASVRLDNIRKVYDNGHVAMAGASFEVEDGELLVLVGPSGCGKSTLLRMVAGLETITDGTLSIGDRVVNDVAPKDRDIAMVFQSYALYPHMDVAGNLAFGLKLRGTPRADIDRRVAQASEMLGLSDMLERRPGQLSGGQRQRVALGRALVREPAVFLLDEPLSNLDAKLRLSMRVEIARLHRRLGATMIYVTHDQIEAMTLGQRIVVLDHGVIQQIDTPMNLYAKPANLFVAGFIGSPAMNFLRGRLHLDGSLTRLNMAAGATLALGAPSPALRAFAGREVVVGLRPEDLRPADTHGDGERLPLTAQLEVIEPVGNEVFLNLRHAAGGLVTRIPPQPLPESGATMLLDFDPACLHFFDAETGRRIDAAMTPGPA